MMLKPQLQHFIYYEGSCSDSQIPSESDITYEY